MVIRYAFPVISGLIMIWGKYYQLNQKAKEKKKKRERKPEILYMRQTMHCRKGC